VSLAKLLSAKTNGSISSILDSAAIAAGEDRERRDIEVHPSEVSHPCGRSIQYNMIAPFSGLTPVALEARVQRIFDTGHSTHRRLYKEMRRAGILKKKEFRLVNKKRGIAGTADCLFVLGGEDVLGDGKSINGNGFKQLAWGAKEEHIQQINLYLWMSGLKKGMLLYERKDDSERRYISVEYDPKVVKRLLKKVLMLHRWVYEKKLLPRIGQSPKDAVCKWCQWRRICFDDDQKISWPETEWRGKRAAIR